MNRLTRNRMWMMLICLLLACVVFSCAGDGDNGDDGDDDADDDAADDDHGGDDDDDSDDDDDAQYPDYPNDDRLRLNHLQAKGTHNSYHVQREGWSYPEHKYTHEPLDVQLDLGVRQFELDVHYSDGYGLRVYHIPIIDEETTCYYLIDCLETIKSWSDLHPGHHPLLVFLETKDEVDRVKLAGRHDEFEQEILSVWPRDRILTPDEVRGEYDTLRDGILGDGWPTLGEVRDRLIVHAHDGGLFRSLYLEEHPELEGALMFVDSNPDDSFAGIMPMNDPIGGGERITEAVEDGFLVRTRADSCCDEAEQNDRERLEAALASGAHAISTDFPAPVEGYDYWVEIPGGTPSRCNPITAPEFCASEDIENLP